ncbi:MAG: ATP-dependent metallopeptidase FtsH/Yme1/Tma family protein, partial [Longimicrobiales bacterium]
MNDRRTRFSILYFVLILAAILGLNYFLARQATRQLAYSELKAKIEAGQVSRVEVGAEKIRAEVRDSLREEGERPDVWTAVRVEGDETLIPLLEAQGIEYEGVTQGW